MITPNDIATKDFKKVAVGYSPEEVDTFLDDIYVDYERLYRESQNPKEQPKPAEPVETADFYTVRLGRHSIKISKKLWNGRLCLRKQPRRK